MIFAPHPMVTRSGSGVCLKVLLNGHEISIVVDDSCGAFDTLRRVRVCIFHGETNVTSSFADGDDEITGVNGDELLALMKKVAAAGATEGDSGQALPAPAERAVTAFTEAVGPDIAAKVPTKALMTAIAAYRRAEAEEQAGIDPTRPAGPLADQTEDITDLVESLGGAISDLFGGDDDEPGEAIDNDEPLDDEDAVLMGAALLEIACAAIARGLPANLLAAHLRTLTAKVEAGHYDPEDIINIPAASLARN